MFGVKTALRSQFQLAADDYVVGIAIARAGPCIVGLGSGQILGIDPHSGRELFARSAHRHGVLSLAWAPDGQHFVTCGQEAVAKWWTNAGVLVREIPTDGPWVEQVAWAPNGQRLAVAAGKKVYVWSDQGEPILTTPPLASTVTGLAWKADSTTLAAACYGGVHLFPFERGAQPRHLAWKGSLISLAWSPNGKVIASCSQDCSVHFWRLPSGADSQMAGFPLKPKALAWEAESRRLATSGHMTVTVWSFRGKGPEGTRRRWMPTWRHAHNSLSNPRGPFWPVAARTTACSCGIQAAATSPKPARTLKTRSPASPGTPSNRSCSPPTPAAPWPLGAAQLK